MAQSAIDRADRLANNAVKGFRRAHAKLNKANDILDAHEAQQREDAEAWRLQIEEAIAQAEESAKLASALRDKNAKKINTLSDLIS